MIVGKLVSVVTFCEVSYWHRKVTRTRVLEVGSASRVPLLEQPMKFVFIFVAPNISALLRK